MKIIFLSHVDFNLYLFRLPVMKAMADAGWEVIALCPDGDYSHRFQTYGITHIPYRIERGSLNPIKELITVWRITKALRKLSPDILHTFTVKPNIYGVLAGSLAGTRHIVCSVTGLGSFFIEKGIKSTLIRTLISSLYRYTFKRAEAVVFQNSDDLELFIKKNIVSREKTFLIKGSGIDTDMWTQEEKLPGSDKQSVLFVGRLLIHKGIREFIEAARRVRENSPQTEFIVAGDFDKGNPYNISKDVFEEAVSRKDITFLGWQEDIRALFRECDLFVLPSYREGMPRTAIEAASMSLPVITTDAVGCREVVEEGYNGYLVPVGESEMLAQRIQTLLNDPVLYRRMAVNARSKAVEEFDIHMIVQRHLELYTSLLKEL